MTCVVAGHRLAGARIALLPDGGRLVVDLSVWASYADAWEHSYAGGSLAAGPPHHRPAGRMSRVLWWVALGETPTAEEAIRRFDHLDRYGPGPAAFTLRSPAPPPSPPVPSECHLQPIGAGEGVLQSTA